MNATFEVYLFEEHSDTLSVWWRQRPPVGTVVYLDAHLDLQETAADGIERLRQCSTAEEVRRMATPHHLDLSQHYAYGIEDFLHPASRLELLERLIWVAPPHIPRGYSRSLVEYMQQMDGIDFDELTAFRPAGCGFRGRLLGLDITICDYDHLDDSDIGSEYALDIDIDYFVEVPGDRLWIDPAAVVDKVLEQLGPPRIATISRAVTSGFTPLPYRFVGDHVRALLAGDHEERSHFDRLIEIATGTGERARRIALARDSLAARPDCPHAMFLAAGLDEDPGTARSLAARAASIDPGYGPDVSRDASAYPHRRLPLRHADLERLLAALAEEQDDERRAPAELAVARLLALAGRLDEAEALLRRQGGEAAVHGDIALDIARAHLGHGSTDRAAAWLDSAARLHRTRTTAVLLRGDLALREGRAREAMQYYDEAADRARAWMLPLTRRRDCLRIIGDHRAARVLSGLIEERSRVIDSLVAKGSAGG